MYVHWIWSQCGCGLADGELLKTSKAWVCVVKSERYNVAYAFLLTTDTEVFKCQNNRCMYIRCTTNGIKYYNELGCFLGLVIYNLKLFWSFFCVVVS